jgi:hypothetical protein
MAYIESAFYQDENSSRDVTKVLYDKVSGTSLDVDVNEKLIPPFEVTDKVELKSEEVEQIRKQAEKECGGNDQQCIAAKESAYRQNALVEKQKEGNSSLGVIKGRRLNVNIIDENNQRRRRVVADGQKFQLDNVTVNDPKKGPLQVPSSEYIQNQFKLLAGIVLATVVYVFSIAATYTLFMQHTALFVAIPVIAISVFIPYSGYVMIFLYFMVKSAINTYVEKVQ